MIRPAMAEETERLLRRLMLALGHYEDPWQLVPLGLLAASVVVIAWHVIAGSAASIQALRIMMVLVMVAGAVGITLHYQGNVEFQLEVHPELSGWPLFANVLHAKAPPALAPGVMAQLGFLGLIYTVKHPALRDR